MQAMTNVKQWMRDATHAHRRLRGLGPPVVATFTPRAQVPGAAQQEATVVAITRRTPDAVTLRLRTGPLSFRAGQFVTLAVSVLGRVHRRNYSVSCAGGATSEIDITVKRVTGGVVSTALSAHARVGDRFGFEGPHGSFVCPPGHLGPLVLVGAGSGITPLYSILLSELSRPRDVALLYGNRSAEATIFREELTALTRAHASLRVLHAREDVATDLAPQESATERTFAGRMGASVIARMLDSVPFAAASDALFFLCGPEPVRTSAREVLEARGVSTSRIHEERYTTPTLLPASAGAVLLPPQQVTFHQQGGPTKGRSVSLTLLPGETLLAAATRGGLAAPFSCAMGGCGECRMRLVSGDVVMEEPNCLLPAERARGEILGCVARPREACVVEVRT